MKLTISGYGKMGKEIEQVAIERNHTIAAIINSEIDWDKYSANFLDSDLVLDFSIPEAAVHNILRCFDAGIPIVVGTSGWYDQHNEIRKHCIEKGCTMFFAPNFSIGANIFFTLNKRLAQLMNPYSEYNVVIEEVHPAHKREKPSGTAIHLANDIADSLNRIDKWTVPPSSHPSQLSIFSKRIHEDPGTHSVKYSSDIDEINIVHTAKNRRGFANGALMAAEWLKGKKGYFEMKDMIQIDI